MNPRRGNGLAVALECCNPGDVPHVFPFLDISLVVWKGSQLDGLLGGVEGEEKVVVSDKVGYDRRSWGMKPLLRSHSARPLRPNPTGKYADRESQHLDLDSEFLVLRAIPRTLTRSKVR